MHFKYSNYVAITQKSQIIITVTPVSETVKSREQRAEASSQRTGITRHFIVY